MYTSVCKCLYKYVSINVHIYLNFICCHLLFLFSTLNCLLQITHLEYCSTLISSALSPSQLCGRGTGKDYHVRVMH